MNYYINGDAAKAAKIKAAFEKLGYDVKNWHFTTGVYYSLNGRIVNTSIGSNEYKLILNNPDYNELELPVEPKFKVGDWIVRGEGFVYEPSLITEIRDYYVCELLNGERVTYTLNDVHKNFHLWTIEDAKDGDVIAFNDSPDVGLPLRWVGIYKQPRVVSNKEYWFHCIITPDSTFRGYDSWWVSNAHPTTKKQRDLLFAKMKEAGYEWDADKKELCKITEPKFKVGDSLQSGSYWARIKRIDAENRRYICDFDNVIPFEEQELWSLVPNSKPHYDIANFHAGMPVLVRDGNCHEWRYVTFSHYRKVGTPFCAGGQYWSQCIPFEGNEHLLGTTDMPSEEYINW